MGQIEKIIDKSYTDMASTIHNLGYSSDGHKSIDKNVLDYVRDNFFVMLNNIVTAVTNASDPKLTEDQRKAITSDSKEYYKELAFFNDRDLKLLPILEKYIDDRDKCIDKLKKRLYRAIPISLIAELAYYKICHRYYDKGLENAFGDIVKGVTIDSTAADDVLNKQTAKKIQRITASAAKAQAEKSYNDIYGDPRLLDKYRIDKSVFMRTISCLLWDTDTAKPETKNTNMSELVKGYSDAINKIFLIDNMYSIDRCFQESSFSFSHNTYKTFFAVTLTPLAGYLYSKISKSYYANYKFILKTLCSDINELITFYWKVFEKKRKNLEKRLKNGTLSRFEYINSIDDFYEMRKLIVVYIQMLIASGAKDKDKYSYKYSLPVQTYTGNDIYRPDEVEIIIKGTKE